MEGRKWFRIASSTTITGRISTRNIWTGRADRPSTLSPAGGVSEGGECTGIVVEGDFEGTVVVGELVRLVVGAAKVVVLVVVVMIVVVVVEADATVVEGTSVGPGLSRETKIFP